MKLLNDNSSSIKIIAVNLRMPLLHLCMALTSRVAIFLATFVCFFQLQANRRYCGFDFDGETIYYDFDKNEQYFIAKCNIIFIQGLILEE